MGRTFIGPTVDFVPVLRATRIQVELLSSAFENWRLAAGMRKFAGYLFQLYPPLAARLYARRVDLRTRLGPLVRVRLADMDAPAEVFGANEYAIPEIDWGSAATIIDAGAHVGSFSLWVAHRCEARVVAIEPNPEVFPLLMHNVAQSPLAGRIECLQAALAGEACARTLVPGRLSPSATIMPVARRGPTYEVAAVTLDGILASATPPVFVKMDIEGAEYEAVDSSAELSRIAVVVIECHGTRSETDHLVAVLEREGLVCRIEDTGQFDMVIGRKE